MYFNTQLGKREQAEPEPVETPAPTKVEAQPFNVGVGERPVQQMPTALERRRTFKQCPLCRGDLSFERGLWLCQGRCHGRWIQEQDRLLDVAALPYGICGCCDEPAVLCRSDIGFAMCPVTNRIHLLNNDGTRLIVDALLADRCSCCQPAHLLARIEQQIVCTHQPHRQYVRDQNGWQQIQVSKQPATLDAIDQALRANTAKVGLYGLFDVD